MSEELKVILNAEDRLSGATRGAKLSLTELKSGLDLARDAYAALERAVDATVGPTMELAQQQRDLARISGSSVEEAGALIQVADDLTVSYSALNQASKRLAAEGQSLTLATVIELGEEYKRLPGPVERAQFAQEKFGRAAGPEMQKLLEKSRFELERMGDAALDSALVMSGEGVDAARQYEIAQDGLNDAMLEAKVIVGTELIPMLTKLTEISTEHLVPAVSAAADWFERGTAAGAQLVQVGRLLWVQYQQTTGAIDDATAALEAQRIVNGGLTDAELRQQRVVEASAARWQGLADAYRDDVTPAVDDATRALDDQKSRLDELNLILAGPIKKEQDEYYARQKDAAAAIVETQGRIQELTALPQLTDAQRAELDELQTRLGEQKQAYEDNATAHEESTARILFGFLQQKLAADGWQEGEIEFLAAVGAAWGIYDQQTATALGNVDSAIAKAHGDANLFVDYMNNSVYSLPDHRINIDVVTRNRTETQYGEEPGPAAPLPPGPVEEPEYDGRRAWGGPVGGGQAYVWNEPGHAGEVLVPAGAGYVLSRDDAMRALSGAAGGQTIIQIDATGSRLSEGEFRQIIEQALDERARLADSRLRMGA